VEDCCWLRTVASDSRDVCRWLRLNKVELCLIVVFKCLVVVFKCLSRPERGMHLFLIFNFIIYPTRGSFNLKEEIGFLIELLKKV
jgi:hypothetical protein